MVGKSGKMLGDLRDRRGIEKKREDLGDKRGGREKGEEIKGITILLLLQGPGLVKESKGSVQGKCKRLKQ